MSKFEAALKTSTVLLTGLSMSCSTPSEHERTSAAFPTDRSPLAFSHADLRLAGEQAHEVLQKQREHQLTRQLFTKSEELRTQLLNVDRSLIQSVESYRGEKRSPFGTSSISDRTRASFVGLSINVQSCSKSVRELLQLVSSLSETAVISDSGTPQLAEYLQGKETQVKIMFFGGALSRAAREFISLRGELERSFAENGTLAQGELQSLSKKLLHIQQHLLALNDQLGQPSEEDRALYAENQARLLDIGAVRVFRSGPYRIPIMPEKNAEEADSFESR